MAELHASINFEVRRKDKVQRVLNLFSKELDRALLDIEIERYWKVDGQFQATFKIPLNTTRREDLVFETLQIANLLQCGMWAVNGPHERNDLVFECYFNNEMDDQSLKWAHLELREG